MRIFVKLPASYLFVDINNKVNAFMKHPDQEIIRLGNRGCDRPAESGGRRHIARRKEMGPGELPQVWTGSGVWVPAAQSQK